MSGLAELSQRFARLNEIRDIMTAMKSLSLVETRKLARSIGHQQRMLANIEGAAGDFLHFFPLAAAPEPSAAILVLIGSERGFCGNFNERVMAAHDRLPPWQPAPALILVGERLGTKFADHAGVVATLNGATVAEDVPAVLDRLLDAVQQARGALAANNVALFCLATQAAGEPVAKRLLPMEPGAPPLLHHLAHAPRLNLTPAAFSADLVDQYLLAALYGQLYGSLAAENRQRLAHMELAIDRLDQTVARVALKRNALRQEKIVEEIEVMLSSAMALARRA